MDPATTMKCQTCGTEIPDDSKFCLSCGRRTTRGQAPPVVQPTKIPLDDDTDTKANLLLAFASMLLFFGIGFLLPRWFFVAVPLFVVGAVLLVARHFVINSCGDKVEKLQRKVVEEFTCQCCGSVNDPGAYKCFDCGAPLPSRRSA